MSYFQEHADGRLVPFILDRTRSGNLINDEPLDCIKEAIFVPKFNVATANSQLVPGIKESYSLLPFRASEERHLPAAIQQRWEASLAASKSAEWRIWFKTLDKKQQKAHVESLSKSTKDTFWAGLWIEYEEWSEPRQTRFIAAAARALAILERAHLRQQIRDAQESVAEVVATFKIRAKILEASGMTDEGMYPWVDLPGGSAEPLSAPPTPHQIVSFGLRLSPCYFRLPTSAFRFATQIFSGKSYEEALAEQKANFSTWVQESKVRRSASPSDYDLWCILAAHKGPVQKLTPHQLFFSPLVLVENPPYSLPRFYLELGKSSRRQGS